MQQQVRFGLVGAGGIAQSYVQAFEGSGIAHLAGVADVRLEAARMLGERSGCPAFTSCEELFKGAELDAVVVCTPPVTHEEVSTYFLNHGVHVLCEKPFAIDLKSARRMVEAARASDVTLTMASKFRYVEDVIKAKRIVQSGILGEVILFENAFTSRVDMSKRWNSDPKISGGGVLMDNGSHSLDLTRYFLGPLADLQVVEGKRVQGLAVEDTVRIFVRSITGVMGSIDLSWSINKELDSYINVYGSQGSISVGWRQSRYRQSSSQDWVVFGTGYDKVQAFRSQIDNFARAIRGEETLLIDAEDGLASVAAIEAAYAAMPQDHWTTVGSAWKPEKRKINTKFARSNGNGNGAGHVPAVNGAGT
jgi:predicted dehydrogenase